MMINPTPKMVWEAINWTGPFLRHKHPWWRPWKYRSSQMVTYVGVLRRFAMAATIHEDFMAEFVLAATEGSEQ